MERDHECIGSPQMAPAPSAGQSEGFKDSGLGGGGQREALWAGPDPGKVRRGEIMVSARGMRSQRKGMPVLKWPKGQFPGGGRGGIQSFDRTTASSSQTPELNPTCKDPVATHTSSSGLPG